MSEGNGDHKRKREASKEEEEEEEEETLYADNEDEEMALEDNGDHKKKREACNEEEALGADNEEEEEEEEEEEMLPDSPNTTDLTTFLKNRSFIDYILTDKFMDMLSSKVESDFELKQLAEELFQSLRNAVEDGEQVSTFVAGVKKLFESDVFIQACVEAHMEDPCLLTNLGRNLNAECSERMEALMRDTFFPPILQETQTNAIIRGVLSVVFGYWGDKDCYGKVSEELKKIPKPDRGPPVEMVFDDIPNIDVSPDIEGLKEALTARYENDPNHDYNHVCKEIERYKSYFEEMVGPFSTSVIPKRIRRLGVLWMGKSLTVSCVDFGQ